MAAPAAARYPADVPTPPSATSSQPRCAAGTVSAISVNAIGSRPPADAPIRKHITRFQPNSGIAPQIAVPMNISADSRMPARRPNTSASRPQITEPTVVPINATSASVLAVGLLIWYSALMPGITKPSVAGFITSMTSATTSTATSVQCSRLSGTPSAIWKWRWFCPCSVCRICASRGISPYIDSSTPSGTSAMPVSMSVSIGMPTICQCVIRPIANIGMCSSTPATTATHPSQNATG